MHDDWDLFTLSHIISFAQRDRSAFQQQGIMDLSSIRPYSFEPRYFEGEVPSDSDTCSSDEEFEDNDDNET